MLKFKYLDEPLTTAETLTYDDGKFQVEVDVKDYKPEEVSINTEGTTLVVLAKHETSNEHEENMNNGWKMNKTSVSNQLEKRFTLPSGCQAEGITSSFSKDGVLTVTVPRYVEQRKTPIGETKWKTENAIEVENNSSTVLPTRNEELPRPKVKYDEDKVQITLDCQTYKPEEVDVKTEGNTIVVTGKQDIKEVGGIRTRVVEQKFTLPSGAKADQVTSSMARDGTLNIVAPRSNPTRSFNNQTIEQKMNRVMSPSSWESNIGKGGLTRYTNDLSGPRRFSSSRTTKKPYTSSSSIPSSFMFDHGGDLSNKWSLFSDSETMDDNDGISKVQYDDGTYKITVNVQSYKPDELTIKTVGNVVQVEAQHTEKTPDGRACSSRNLTQSFPLPKGVNPDDVKSSLSKDGTLIIEAPLPKPQTSVKGLERVVPISCHR